jgi:hypothetical protein
MAGTPALAGAAGGRAVAGTGGQGEGGMGEAGAGGAPDLGITKVTDVDSFRRAEYDAICAYIFSCDLTSSDDGEYLRFLLGTEQRCRDLFENAALREPAFQDLDTKVRAGTIEMDLAAVAACIDSLVSCAPQSMKSYDVAACRAVFHGSSPLGGACSRSEDCADDGRCVIGAACPGVCTARVALGGECASDSDCDDHTGPVTCAESGTSSSAPSTCQPLTLHLGTLNEACDFAANACAQGLYCHYVDGGSSTCMAPVPANSACDSDNDACADGQACRNGLCQPVTLETHVGDDCDTDYIKVCDFVARLYCVNQKCELLGDGAEGAACHPIDYSAFGDCNAGLVCLDPDPSSNVPSPDGIPRGVCGKPRSANQPCQENDDCASEYCQTDGTCGAAYCCGQESCQSN